MNILFVHQNFPGQFKNLAPAVKARGHRVVAMSMNKPFDHPDLAGIERVYSKASRSSSKTVHPWVTDFEAKVIRAEATFRRALELKKAGFTPDLIVAHPGWGESLFMKDVWPQAKLGIYCEFFYNVKDADTDFDPEFPPADPEGDGCRLHIKNVNNWLHFEVAQAGISPTQWQASTFPQPFRDRISVIHDGIDTDLLVPKAEVNIALGSGATLARGDEVITFVNRNLEPYRGYHVFMRALPEILRRRPKARVLLVGANDVSYGPRPKDGRTWREIFQSEVQAELDMSRVHFLGQLPYKQFVSVLQVSAVHVYLTYPFVLSWSLLEAMSTGCAIVASDTRPLHEAIRHGDTGRLVGFFDRPALVDEVCGLLGDPGERARLGANAREFARASYDLRSVCLPRQLAWMSELAGEAV